MSFSLKVYGILFVLVILIIAIFDFQRNTIQSDDIFNATRNTQLSVIEESIEWGNLLVNDTLSIDQMNVDKRWKELIDQNLNSKIDYQIAVLHSVNVAPMIGVKINYRGENKLLEDTFDTYSNIIILERR